jgi:hypothetical protein
MSCDILAIDPGTTESAWVWLHNGIPSDYRKQDNAVMMDWLRRRTAMVTVIEEIRSYGMPVGIEVFDAVRWTGRFQEALENRGQAVHLMPRQTVKLHLCRSPRANDPVIRQALIDRFGGSSCIHPGKACRKRKNKSHSPACPLCHGSGMESEPGCLAGISGDIWAALALAVTFYDRSKGAV